MENITSLTMHLSEGETKERLACNLQHNTLPRRSLLSSAYPRDRCGCGRVGGTLSEEM